MFGPWKSCMQCQEDQGSASSVTAPAYNCRQVSEENALKIARDSEGGIHPYHVHPFHAQGLRYPVCRH